MSIKTEQFFVNEDSVKSLKLNRDRLALRFQVKIILEGCIPSLKETKGSWCNIQGDSQRTHAAMTYIKAMTSPEDTAEMKIPYVLFGELTDEKARQKLERETKAVVEYREEAFNNKDFTATVKGESMAVALALSLLEDRLSKLAGEQSHSADEDERVVSTSMNQYSKSTSTRLDQSLLAMSDEYEIDKKHLDKIPDIVKKLIVSWANEDSDDDITFERLDDDDSLDMDLSSGEPSDTMLTLSETGYDQSSTITPRVSIDPSFKPPDKSTTPINSSYKTTSTPYITNVPTTSKQIPDITPINVRSSSGLTVDLSKGQTSRPPHSFHDSLDSSTDKFPVLLSLSSGDEDETIIQVPSAQFKQSDARSNRKKKSVADRLKEGMIPSDSGDETVIYKSPKQSKSTVVVKREASKSVTDTRLTAAHREVVEVRSDEEDSVIEIPKMSAEEKEFHEHMIQKFMNKASQLGYDQLDIAKTNSMLDTVKLITEQIYFDKLDKISPSTTAKRFISPLKPTPDEKRLREDEDSVDHKRRYPYERSTACAPCPQQRLYTSFGDSNKAQSVFPHTQPTQIVNPQIPIRHELPTARPPPHQNLPPYVQNDPIYPNRAPQREVVRVHDEAEAKAALHRPVKELLHVEQERVGTVSNLAPLVMEVKMPRRMVILDGSNVAFAHGKRGTSKNFSCKGIALAIQYLSTNFQCQNIKCVVPLFRKSDHTVQDRFILDQLDDRDYMIFSPSKKVGGKRMVPYDDRLILDFAREANAVVISNDRYVDLLVEDKYKDVIMNRVIMYTFMGDMFYVPDDPMGRDGPSLEVLLTDPQSRSRPNSGYHQYSGKAQAPLGGYNSQNDYQHSYQQPSTSQRETVPPTNYRLPVQTNHMRRELLSMFPDDAQGIEDVLQNFPSVTDVNLMVNLMLGQT